MIIYNEFEGRYWITELQYQMQRMTEKLQKKYKITDKEIEDFKNLQNDVYREVTYND